MARPSNRRDGASSQGGGAPDPPDGWLVVAEIGPPHGLRGEVVARLSGVGPEEIREIEGLVLRWADGRERPTRVVRARPRKVGWILEIEGVRNRTESEGCRDAVLLASRDELPAPGEDEWYVADLVGMQVETEDGERLGVLDEVLQLPANDVFVVRGKRGEILLPVTEEVVREVEVEAGRVKVRLLPGLLDDEEPKGRSDGGDG